MDIFGVQGVEAEAELLSAVISSFQVMGITAKDVGIKVQCTCSHSCFVLISSYVYRSIAENC